ncbi:hypothetical protein KI387_033591 [Taxus chinensis]|uniref:Seven-in-absentia protein TRAF-like domain-containing protein n=1 Tax=Taxus chinensis TaxID=29808 RepID=A0AA38C3C0_TAXCH|nr:hypothetical protein KI387_033591 [Taxus chinensis]
MEHVSSSTILFAELAATLMEAGGNGGKREIGDLSSGTIDEAVVLIWWPTHVYIAFMNFMGDDNDAKNFSYSLEVGGNGQKLTCQGIPRSTRDNHRKVRDSHDGLIIQRNMALFFSGSDRKELKLRLTGRIWKEQ